MIYRIGKLIIYDIEKTQKILYLVETGNRYHAKALLAKNQTIIMNYIVEIDHGIFNSVKRVRMRVYGGGKVDYEAEPSADPLERFPFAAKLDELVKADKNILIVVEDDGTFLSTDAIAKILATHKKMERYRDSGTAARIGLVPDSATMSAIKRMKLEDILELYDTEEAAIEAWRNE